MSSPHIPESIRAMFDSCRDDFDLAQPEMQPLRTWLNESIRHREALVAMRRMDARIKGALHDVAIPSGLKEKILRLVGEPDAPNNAKVFLENIDLSEVDFDHPTGSVAPKIAPRVSPHFATRHSIWLAAGISLATISAVVFAILSWGQFGSAFPSNPSARELCLASLSWIQQADNSPWLTDSGPNGEERAFVPKQISRKRIQTNYGPTACYLTSLNNGARVFQFVFRANGSMGLPSQAPASPGLPAQGFVCSAYQQGDQVFVLAVEGDAENYRQALEHGLPVTRIDPFAKRVRAIARSSTITGPVTIQDAIAWLIGAPASYGRI